MRVEPGGGGEGLFVIAGGRLGEETIYHPADVPPLVWGEVFPAHCDVEEVGVGAREVGGIVKTQVAGGAGEAVYEEEVRIFAMSI